MFHDDNLDSWNVRESMVSSIFRENNGRIQPVSGVSVMVHIHRNKCCIDIRLRFQNRHQSLMAVMPKLQAELQEFPKYFESWDDPAVHKTDDMDV